MIQVDGLFGTWLPQHSMQNVYISNMFYWNDKFSFSKSDPTQKVLLQDRKCGRHIVDTLYNLGCCTSMIFSGCPNHWRAICHSFKQAKEKKKEVTLVMCIPCRYISTFKVSMIDEAIWCASTLSSSASPTVVTLHQFSKLILHHCKPLEVLCNFPDMWQSLAVQLVHASRVLLI